MILERENLARIRTALKFHPKGLNITEISHTLKINRNSAAKYLEILMITGQVEAKTLGPSKVYTLSERVPLSALMNLPSGMMLIVDQEDRILRANDLFFAFTGTAREEVIGKRIADTGLPFLTDFSLTGPDQQGARQDIAERRVIWAGKENFFRIMNIPTIFDNGDEGRILYLADISERKRSENLLREREKLYRSVIENIQDVFYRSDNAGNLIMASPSWATMLGYDSLDECIGKNIAEQFYIEPQKRRELLDVIAGKGFVQDYHVVLKCKDGSPLPVSTNSHRYYDDGGSVLGVEGIFRNISEQCRAEEKIRSHIRDMEFLSQKLMEFIDIPTTSDLYAKIATDLQLLIPDAVVIVGSYDAARGTATPRAMLDENARGTARQFLGFDLVGAELPVTAIGLNAYRSARLEKFALPVHEAAFRAIPEKICTEFADRLAIGNLFAIGLTRGSETLGGVLLLLKKGTSVNDRGLVETYVRQASIALQRRRAEDSFRQSQQLFFNMAELSPVPITIMDAKGTYTYINRSFTRLFGYTLDDFTTEKEWLLLAFPDPAYRSRVAGAGIPEPDPDRAAIPRQALYRLRGKDRTDKEVLILPVTLDEGRTCTVYEDLTERRDAEKTRRLLSAIVTSTDDAIIGKKPDGTIISWNPAAERMYGYRAEEVIGQNISVIIPPELRPEMQSILDRIRTVTSIKNLETSRIQKNGKKIDVNVTVSPIVDEDGIVIGASTIARDISALKTEERLKESEEKYQSLVENINVGVYRSTGDPRGRFVWGNPSLLRILGYPTFESLESREIADMFVEPDGRKKLLEELHRNGFVRNREILLKKSEGAVISVLVTALAKTDKNGEIEYISGLVEDITDRHRTDSLVRALKKEMMDIIDLLPDPTFIIDAAKNVVAWNTAMERFTGVKRDQIAGRSSYRYAIPLYGTLRPALIDCVGNDPGDSRQYYPDLREKENGIEADLFSPEMHQGSGAYFSVRASPLTDPAGSCIGAIETIREISDTLTGPEKPGATGTPGGFWGKGGAVRRPHAASENQVPPMISLLYLSNALKLAHDGILILDRSARCVWVNNSLVDLLGLGESTPIVGKSISSFVRAQDHKLLSDQLFSVGRAGPVSFTISFLTPTWQRPVETSVSHISDENGDLLGYMAILRNRPESLRSGSGSDHSR